MGGKAGAAALFGGLLQGCCTDGLLLHSLLFHLLFLKREAASLPKGMNYIVVGESEVIAYHPGTPYHPDSFIPQDAQGH